MTEPIKPPKISYDIVSDVWDNSDVFRFFDECTSAIFDEMDHIFDDCEVTAGFVRQMLIEKAAKYQIRRRGRPHGSRTKIPAENLSPSSQARRQRRERAEARVFDKYITEQKK